MLTPGIRLSEEQVAYIKLTLVASATTIDFLIRTFSQPGDGSNPLNECADDIATCIRILETGGTYERV